MLAPWKKSCDQLRQHIKKQRHYFANKGLNSQTCGFSYSHVWMWELDYKESWAPKNWCFWTVVLEKTLESPLDNKEIQPVHPKGNQFWILEGLKFKLKSNTLATWCEELTHLKRPWCWERLRAGGKGDDRGGGGFMSSLSRWTWVGDGQESLACCSLWGHKELDMTEQVNCTNIPFYVYMNMNIVLPWWQ